MKNFLLKAVIILLLASLVAGQLVRLPLPGQGGGLLVSDVATVLVLCAALLQGLKKHKFQNTEHKQSTTTKTQNNSLGFVICVLCFFILWSLFTLILHFSSLGSHNFVVALLYWLRLTAALLLLPALLFLFQNKNLQIFTQKAFLGTAALLVLFGFLQLIFFPDLHQPGWDPHRGRLFSTWLDPNLFGGFLIVILPWLGFLPLTKGEYRAKRGVGVLLLAALIALLLTQSRSSFLALASADALLLPFLRKVFLLPLALAFFTLALAALIFFPQRLIGLFTVDETAALRLTSLSSAWQLVEQSPWTGTGYNAYQFAAREAGLIQDFSLHSRAGTDNSLLTLAVTTGLPGVVLFLLPWLMLSHRLPFAANFSLLALFIHSQFVNSFLYSHLLITLIIITALCFSMKNPSFSSRPSSPAT